MFGKGNWYHLTICSPWHIRERSQKRLPTH
ncbi:rCG64145 [Rattus norvegicus]|uniref:RCG64145 n=1 Tax=Rattus norvegicus TaxID=10116 RepID=A6HVK1_RAT|nr:rCG64145 [Rattus norvegicus]